MVKKLALNLRLPTLVLVWKDVGVGVELELEVWTSPWVKKL